jgi:hypothetical protein
MGWTPDKGKSYSTCLSLSLSFFLLLPCDHKARRLLSDINTFLLDFSASKTERTTLIFFINYLVCGVLLQEHKK